MRNGTRVKLVIGTTLPVDDNDTYKPLTSGVTGTVVRGIDTDEDSYDSSPSRFEVRWDDGKISEHDWDDITDVTPRLFVNVYLHDRAYGGPEEGGWWYDTYDPWEEECKVFDTEEEARHYHAVLHGKIEDENGNRRSDINSVLSEGRYVAFVEAFPPRPLPTRRPYYC